jgi:flagellin
MDDLASKINEAGGGTVQATVSEDGQLVIHSETAKSIAASGTVDKAGLTAVTQHAQLKFTITDPNLKGLDIDASADPTKLEGVGLNKVNTGEGSVSGAADGTTLLAADQVVINGVSVGAGTAASSDAIRAAINRISGETGVVAGVGSGADIIKLTSTDTSKAITIESGAGFSQATEQLRDEALKAATGLFVTNEAETTTNTVANIDLSTAAGAQKAISVLDEAVQQVSEIRGDLGAISNRLDYTTRNLSNISENAASARSQIMDADFAAESANLSRAQVLQQAGNAMLAQANSRPQQVLSLLQ